MHAIWLWLFAGSPAHWMTYGGCLAYALLEWVLPRQKALAADSTVELLANLAKKVLLDKIPLVGRLVAFLASPVAVPAIAPAEVSK